MRTKKKPHYVPRERDSFCRHIGSFSIIYEKVAMRLVPNLAKLLVPIAKVKAR